MDKFFVSEKVAQDLIDLAFEKMKPDVEQEIANERDLALLRRMQLYENAIEMGDTKAALEVLKDISDDILQIGPMLRKSIKKEAGFDIDKVEKRINEILRHEIEFDVVQ